MLKIVKMTILILGYFYSKKLVAWITDKTTKKIWVISIPIRFYSGPLMNLI